VAESVTEDRNDQQPNWMYRSVSEPKWPRIEVAACRFY